MGTRRAAGLADRSGHTMIDAIQRYWNEHIHDLKMTRHAVGTREFFDDLDDYRFDKLHYLPRLVDFKNGYKDRTVLEVGCGIGIDLLRFARAAVCFASLRSADISKGGRKLLHSSRCLALEMSRGRHAASPSARCR